ncbi:MAG: thioredoxin domain-containing protein, partial [Gemmatimonadaceae bacterium]
MTTGAEAGLPPPVLLQLFAERQVKKRERSFKYPVAVFLIVFCVVLTATTFAKRSALRANAPTDAPVYVTNWQDVARVGHSVGGASPKATVTVFADYQCAGCAAFHPMLQTAARLMGEDLRIVTRHFPLTAHPHATAAANAAECAAEQGRFAQMEDVLYAQQDSIGVLSWTVYAIRAGVRDTASFGACVKQSRFGEAVKSDREAAKSLKLKGTPSYIVNGELRFGAPSQAVLLQQLRDAVSLVRVASLDSSRSQPKPATGSARTR